MTLYLQWATKAQRSMPQLTSSRLAGKLLSIGRDAQWRSWFGSMALVSYYLCLCLESYRRMNGYQDKMDGHRWNMIGSYKRGRCTG
eukprot:492773-Amphidinium_carterae.1